MYTNQLLAQALKRDTAVCARIDVCFGDHVEMSFLCNIRADHRINSINRHRQTMNQNKGPRPCRRPYDSPALCPLWRPLSISIRPIIQLRNVSASSSALYNHNANRPVLAQCSQAQYSLRIFRPFAAADPTVYTACTASLFNTMG